jgi:sirohydrochlorin ferrochelatase
LENVLARTDLQPGTVIIALLFLSPGRHAGVGGDIARICAAATVKYPRLCPVLTLPIGDDPKLIDILADRTAAALEKKPT